MGNRALIVAPGAPFGIYLHWNGGYDSVFAFLKYAELAQLPGLDRDGRGVAQLATVMNNFFGNDGNTICIEAVDPEDLEKSSPGDNGVYLVEGHNIVGRLDMCGAEQRHYDLDTMLESIDSTQRAEDQLGAYLEATEAPVSELKVGQQVWVYELRVNKSKFKLRTVLGFGTDQMVNGRNVLGVPYIDRFDNDQNATNPNSYLRGETVRIPAS